VWLVALRAATLVAVWLTTRADGNQPTL